MYSTYIHMQLMHVQYRFDTSMVQSILIKKFKQHKDNQNILCVIHVYNYRGSKDSFVNKRANRLYTVEAVGSDWTTEVEKMSDEKELCSTFSILSW